MFIVLHALHEQGAFGYTLVAAAGLLGAGSTLAWGPRRAPALPWMAAAAIVALAVLTAGGGLARAWLAVQSAPAEMRLTLFASGITVAMEAGLLASVAAWLTLAAGMLRRLVRHPLEELTPEQTQARLDAM